jgi:tetratricopeptide (TPR) repeat protein
MADAAPALAKDLFAEALALHQAGQLADAEQIYHRILAAEPGHFDSLHLLGVIFLQRGDAQAAVRQISAALKVAPHHILALNNRGNALQQLREFGAALDSYDRALSVRPDYVEALINRGVTLNALKRYAEALASYDRAIALRPDLPEAHSNRGNVLAALGRRDEALASFDRALMLRPDYAQAHYNRGNALHALKRHAEALASFDRALAAEPDYVDALTNRAVSLHELKRDSEALESLDRALALDPGNVEALTNRGVARNALARYDEALIDYDRALALRPDHADALTNRGVTLHELLRLDEALASYDRALMLRPDDAEALSNRGHTLHEMMRCEEALASCDRAIALRPDLAAAHCNRGNALNSLRRFDEALASYDQALKLRPDYPEALTNRGIALHFLQRFDEEMASYARALAIAPDYSEAHFNVGWCRMLLGDLRWDEYEWRWRTRQKYVKRSFAQPSWSRADDVAGKTVLLHAEQGFGDTIQFCRYVPLVAQRAARVIFEVQAPLRELMRDLPGVAQIVARGDALPEFDLQCPLLTLPYLFGTELSTIPADVPYLRARPQAVAEWRARLGDNKRPRIGLAWAGSATQKNDLNRSVPLAALLPLLDLDVTYVSLLREVRAGEADLLRERSEIIHFGEALKDFADTAALIENLDLVISVDTAVAHLAGALGKPLWAVLALVPDWRWLLDRDDNPWYPTARLFRQDNSAGWNNVIARVAAALRERFAL